LLGALIALSPRPPIRWIAVSWRAVDPGGDCRRLAPTAAAEDSTSTCILADIIISSDFGLLVTFNQKVTGCCDQRATVCSVYFPDIEFTVGGKNGHDYSSLRNSP